jgi:NitT/TauT family transport system ATP-binding protein
MIELHGLSKVYESTGAGLGPTSVQIPEGEWVTILGPSGSGKSTLLKLISGLETPSSGNVQLGLDRSKIGVVFQEHALLPWKTVLENICLPVALRHGAKAAAVARERAQPWIRKLRIESFLQRYPDELSGGLRMRVSLARALISEPKLLLLDEPFSALDEPIRIELGLELRELWKQLKPTVLMVTHSITEGLWLADRVLVMQGRPGRIGLDQATGLGVDRSLAQRATPEFHQRVETCFNLLRGEAGK